MAASEEAKALREEFERTNEALRDITANLNLAAQNTEGFDESLDFLDISDCLS